MEYQAMDQEFGIIELPPPSFPLPLSTPPPPSSSSQPTPPQFLQAGWPKGNYRLPARYEDSLCGRLRKKTSSQLQHYPICIWLCTIDCRLPQIPLAYCKNTLTGLPLILTPLFPKRTFTKLEGLILYLFSHHPHPLFIEMNQSKCLWTGRTLAHPQNQMLRSIIL